jgi:hypothetical protein
VLLFKVERHTEGNPHLRARPARHGDPPQPLL